MVIEQDFNRRVKDSKEVITHGRTITDPSVSRFIFTVLFFVDITKGIEKIIGVIHSTSEQSIDASDLRMQHDAEDIKNSTIFLKFLFRNQIH